MKCVLGLSAALFYSIFFGLFLFGCGSANTTSVNEDSSVSGMAASAAGGTLSMSGANATQAFLNHGPIRSYFAFLDFLPSAWAATTCPNYKTTSTGCAASGNSLWLTYSSCAFSASQGTWTGFPVLISSATTMTCGTFPTISSGTLSRQYVNSASSTTPSSATFTSVYGSVATLDHASNNLSNFDSVAVTPIVNGGYGEQATITSGVRTSLALATRLSTAVLDHSIVGNLAVTETVSSSSRTLNGTIKVYHNLLKVVGSSVFTSVTYTDSCCQPMSGNIKTTYASGTTVTTPTTAGSRLVGLSETLTFNGTCGQGTLVDTTGASTTVTLTRCF